MAENGTGWKSNGARGKLMENKELGHDAAPKLPFPWMNVPFICTHCCLCRTSASWLTYYAGLTSDSASPQSEELLRPVHVCYGGFGWEWTKAADCLFWLFFLWITIWGAESTKRGFTEQCLIARWPSLTAMGGPRQLRLDSLYQEIMETRVKAHAARYRWSAETEHFSPSYGGHSTSSPGKRGVCLTDPGHAGSSGC